MGPARSEVPLSGIRPPWEPARALSPRDFHNYVVARLPYINPSPGAEAVLLDQRARADADWAEKLATKAREKLRVEGEGLASSARAGRGTAVEGVASRRADPRAGAGVAAAAEAARAARLIPEQVQTRKEKEAKKRQAKEQKAMAAEEKAMRREGERRRKTAAREEARAAKAAAAEARARNRGMAKRAKAKAKAEAKTREAAAKAEAKAEAKEAKEEKRAAEKKAKAEAKTAKAAQKEATRTTKAGAKARRAVEKEAKNEEQEQKTTVVSTGYNIGTGGVRVDKGRARRASRRATGVG